MDDLVLLTEYYSRKPIFVNALQIEFIRYEDTDEDKHCVGIKFISGDFIYVKENHQFELMIGAISPEKALEESFKEYGKLVEDPDEYSGN